MRHRTSSFLRGCSAFRSRTRRNVRSTGRRRGFGVNGWRQVDTDATEWADERVLSLARQADGKIIAAGYTQAGGLTLARLSGMTRHYAMQDANWNLTGIVDPTTGQVVERYVFTPYGGRTILAGDFSGRSSSSFGWAVGHQGLTHDAETGLVYNRARYLDTSLGRFTQRDPLGYVDGMSLYEYVRSIPTLDRDPSGRQALYGGFRAHWGNLPSPPHEEAHLRPVGTESATYGDDAIRLRLVAALAGGTAAGLTRSMGGLAHYLGGSGDAMIRHDITDMLKSSPSAMKGLFADFRDAFWSASLLASRSEKAVSYRIVNQWKTGAIQKSESFDWFGLFRGYSAISEARFTVWPLQNGCRWVDMVFYHPVYKEYNFDPGEVFPIPGAPTGTQMARLHDVGYAKNFSILGAVYNEFSWFVTDDGGVQWSDVRRNFDHAKDPATWKDL